MKRTVPIILAIVAAVAVTRVADRRWLRRNEPKAKVAEAAGVPNFTLKDLQGKDVSLEQFKGKVVLVNFWATWCSPCRIEIPWFIEFQQKYGGRGFAVLGIAMDDEGKEAVGPYVGNERFEVNGQPRAINYPILLGNDAMAQQFGGLIGIPTSVLISRDGKKVKTFIGLVNHKVLSEEIEAQL
jgi:thiol-disulfide isomerase/thioredoxin